MTTANDRNPGAEPCPETLANTPHQPTLRHIHQNELAQWQPLVDAERRTIKDNVTERIRPQQQAVPSADNTNAVDHRMGDDSAGHFSSVNRLYRLGFVDHPRSVDESYSEHFRVAMGFSGWLFTAATAAFCHAIVPGTFKTTASGIITRLHDRMVINRVRRR